MVGSSDRVLYNGFMSLSILKHVAALETGTEGWLTDLPLAALSTAVSHARALGLL